jgi:glyoxylase-like metal-dependent hydrolase (beta-lactamase superfamily II)
MTATDKTSWYAHRTIGDGVSLIWETQLKPFYRCNIWHVRGRDGDILIDSGMGLRPLAPVVAAITEKPVTAIASHGHVDHIGGHHEFAARAIHADEAATLAKPDRRNTIAEPYFTLDMFEGDAPEDFNLATYCVRAAPATRVLQAGDIVDLGDRAFEVLHLPGHSPGSIALWDANSGILFSGDTVYDGPLVDDFYHSVVDDYVASMERLRKLPVRVVHAGHFPSFGRERLIALIDEYVAGKHKPGCPA